MSLKTAMGFSFRRKTIAVFFVLFFLVMLLYFRAQKQSIPTAAILELDHFLQHTIDSLKANEQPKTIYPFNPNFISDQRGYFLGLSPQEIDLLHAYRKQGKWINSLREFQKVTGVDSTWLKVPYLSYAEARKVVQLRTELKRMRFSNLQSIKGFDSLKN